MDQSELLHLPVVDMPMLDMDVRDYCKPKREASPAQAAARILKAHASSSVAAPMSAAMRAQFAQLREDITMGVTANAMREQQAAQWSRADNSVRKLLVLHAGLRALHPEHTLQQLADRSWQETPPDERLMLASTVRVLQNALVRLGKLAALRVKGFRVAEPHHDECLNPECGASFVAQSALLERLSMPSQPSASVTIPLSPHVNRERLRQLLTDAPRGEYRATTMAPPNGELFDSPAAGPPEPQPA